MKRCSPKTCFWIVIRVIFLHSVSVVGQQCELHESIVLQRCCIAVTVPKGYQPVMCNADGEAATFELCPAYTFQPNELLSVSFRLCQRHSTCPSPNMVTVSGGNSVSNTGCGCNERGGYRDSRSYANQPPESYHCVRGGKRVSPSSSSVHPSSSVNDPAKTETSTGVPLSEQLGRMSLGFGIVSLVFGIAGFVAYKYRQYFDNLCKRQRNESAELSSIAGADQTNVQHNGQLPDESHSVETDAHRPLNSTEGSNRPDGNDCGSDMGVNYNLRPDHDDSNVASLCCELDDRRA